MLSVIPDVQIQIKKLEIGDYLCAEHVVIERKSAADFVASILDKRLFEQVTQMTMHYQTAILVLEGDAYDTRSAIKPEALDGALSYLVTLAGISLVPTSSAQHTARVIATIARHAQHGLGYEIPLRYNKPKQVHHHEKDGLKNRVYRQQQFLVEGLPGVGPERARTLLKRFGSPQSIFQASPEDMQSVKGIGEKAMNEISKVMTTSYDKKD